MWFQPSGFTNKKNLTNEEKQILFDIAIRTPIALSKVGETLSGQRFQETIPLEAFSKDQKTLQYSSKIYSCLKEFGSDKINYGYHLIYAHILNLISNKPSILEIGLGSNDPNIISNMAQNYIPGASIKAFRKLFPNSIIDGADIDQTISIENSRVFHVDQTKPETFKSIINGGEHYYDLIIDDGMHSTDSNLFTLDYALRHISANGFIVIEDILERHLLIWQIIINLMES